MFKPLVSSVLMIESLYIVHLVGCYREVLVLACSEEGILVIQSVSLRVVLVGLLGLKILIECRREHTPTTKVEEAMTFHSQLYAALPAQCLAGIVLTCEVTV